MVNNYNFPLNLFQKALSSAWSHSLPSLSFSNFTSLSFLLLVLWNCIVKGSLYPSGSILESICTLHHICLLRIIYYLDKTSSLWNAIPHFLGNENLWVVPYNMDQLLQRFAESHLWFPMLTSKLLTLNSLVFPHGIAC